MLLQGCPSLVAPSEVAVVDSSDIARLAICCEGDWSWEKDLSLAVMVVALCTNAHMKYTAHARLSYKVCMHSDVVLMLNLQKL